MCVNCVIFFFLCFKKKLLKVGEETCDKLFCVMFFFPIYHVCFFVGLKIIKTRFNLGFIHLVVEIISHLFFSLIKKKFI